MHSGKFSLTPKNQVNDTDSSLPSNHDSSLQDPICVSSSSSDEKDDQSNNEVSNQLVIYDPVKNGNNTIELVPDPLQCEPPLRPKNKPSSSTPRILPAVGAFTVQCASCFKWRLIPTKEKYEEIREHILEQPFVCEKAREWRPNVSCDDPEDISQDGSRVWAIDKPSIAQPPAGWQRLLRIRGEGSTKFADIYYEAPSGKRLRSMVEVQKFLMDHPEYMESGVSLSRFSFQVPKPLQENYVRKRSAPRLTGLVEPQQVSPLAWVSPDDSQERRPELSGSHIESHVSDPDSRPTKKQSTRRSLQKDAVE